jgi:hypothetical protein
MTPGTKCGGGAEIDKRSAENDKNSAENDEIEVPKKSAETGGNRQFTAVQSISRTMVCTSAEEPKIALLHGPPG